MNCLTVDIESGKMILFNIKNQYDFGIIRIVLNSIPRINKRSGLMKKIITWSLILTINLCWFIPSQAADLSGFKKYAPNNINLMPFETNAYVSSFDSFKYVATIQTQERIFDLFDRIGEAKDLWASLRLGILMTASPDGKQVYTPYLYCGASQKLGDVYIRIGENRYVLHINRDNNAYLGKNGFLILQEIVSTNERVYVTVNEFTATEKYCSVIPKEKIGIIKQFVDDCKKSGIYDTLPDDDDSAIIVVYSPYTNNDNNILLQLLNR